MKRNQLPDSSVLDGIAARAEKILGYEFKDKSLIIRALTHPSAVEADPVALSYERLEFLGDSYLGIIIGKALFDRFPNLPEGGLSRLKAAIVSGSSLSEIASNLGFSELIVFGESELHTGNRGMHSALENVYEAIVAALAIDGGFDVARSWVLSTTDHLLREDLDQIKVNAKSRLQEILQSDHRVPKYEVVEEIGPAHDRTFRVEASCDGELLGSGLGRTKKEAETAAAEQALETLGDRG
ncbi:MAG: ribonuclease III [bacterium]|nr:ribonuclease III [bacterium]